MASQTACPKSSCPIPLLLPTPRRTVSSHIICAKKESGFLKISLASLLNITYSIGLHAEVAQLVEHNLAKVGVAGSSPVFRSKCSGAGFLADAFLLPRYSKLLVIRLPLGRRWSIQGLWGETGPLPYVTCGFANRAQCASPLTKQEIRRPARNLAGLLRYFHHSGVSSPNVTILPSS